MTYEEQIETLEVENRMLRARCERLESELVSELDAAKCVIETLVEERGVAIKAYRELLLKYDRMEERTQK
jgi:hypothetical protein